MFRIKIPLKTPKPAVSPPAGGGMLSKKSIELTEKAIAKDNAATKKLNYLIFIQCCGFLNLPTSTSLARLRSEQVLWMTKHPFELDENRIPIDELNQYLYAHTMLVLELKKLEDTPLPLKLLSPDEMKDARQHGQSERELLSKEEFEATYQRGKNDREKINEILYPRAKWLSVIPNTNKTMTADAKSQQKLLSLEEYYLYITSTVILGFSDFRDITVKEIQKRKHKFYLDLHPDRLAGLVVPPLLQTDFRKVREELFIDVNNIADRLITYFSESGLPPRPINGFDKLERSKVLEAIQKGKRCLRNMNLPPLHYQLNKLIEEQLKLLFGLLPTSDNTQWSALPESMKELCKEMKANGCLACLQKGINLLNDGGYEAVIAYKTDLDRFVAQYSHLFPSLPNSNTPLASINSINHFWTTLSKQNSDSDVLTADEKGEITKTNNNSL